jgi:hypothetical protein
MLTVDGDPGFAMGEVLLSGLRSVVGRRSVSSAHLVMDAIGVKWRLGKSLPA